MIRKLGISGLFLGLFLIISCGEYRKIQKSTDMDLKLEKAISYYDQGDYFKAHQLLDELVPYFKGTLKAETVSYYYAYCYYHQRSYLLASYYFKRFYIEYPNSDKAEECFYMNAYCKVMESPVYSLDQTNTLDAIKELQLFINYFPESDSLERCNNLIDEMRYKLQLKDFRIAQLYFQTGNYSAAVTAYRNVIKDYPDTRFKEETLYMIANTFYHYALNSIESKQMERYKESVNAYLQLRESYPESAYLAEAERWYTESQNKIEYLNSKKANDGL